MTYPWFDTLFQQLTDRARHARLHHALLMLGPKGLGKTALARDFGAYLLCQNPRSERCGQCQACHLVDAGSHPDLHQIQSEKQIGVDDIRSAIEKLSGKSQLRGAKVLVIHQADSMTESAANALLKTLEEPTPQTYMLLTASSAQRLLPTIKSRCEKLLLPQATHQQTSQWMSSQYQGEIEPQLLAMYGACPLILLELLNEQGGNRYCEFIDNLQQVIESRQSSLEMAQQWQENPGRLLEWLQHWLLETLKNGKIPQDAAWTLNSRCLAASRAVSNAGLNKVLMLSELLSAFRILRS
ncbi:DNA polymerase III subunit delta' [Bowmanella denitrificans]|uniref:DNA-directed DNA polymerase n=1 Tax=Bowmanella denitrificans TaxID=366582 RepID=A0ABP3GH91_9ALTE